MVHTDEQQKLIDELLEIPTTKVMAPYYSYDYIKVQMGIKELLEFIKSRCYSVYDSKTKEDFIERILDLLIQKNIIQEVEAKELFKFLFTNI